MIFCQSQLSYVSSLTVFICQMEDKQSGPTNAELPKDQLESKDSCGDELQSDGDGEEKPAEGNGFVTQLADSQSLSSEDSSKNDGLRSKIPRVNCPEHIVRMTF